jgi:transmembrane sensor
MNPSGKSEDIEAAAAAWFERREWSDWDATSEKALEAWLSEATAHRIAFIRLQAAWERAERLRALGAGVPLGRVPERASFGFPQESIPIAPSEGPAIGSGPADDKRWWSGRLKWAIGAPSLAAALALIVWYQSAARWQVYGTPVGTIAPVVLADGSRITLDSNTRIQVDLQATQRLVRLDRGEALFDVAKDTSRPLIIQIANKRVTAVGTEFSVRRDAEGIRVLVKEGRVKVENYPSRSGSDAIELEPGGEAFTHENEISVQHVGLTEVERALSWHEGYLEFQETPLTEAVAEFNRYSIQRIVIDDPRLNSIRIGGRFRCTDVNAFLTLLGQGFPVAVTRDGNRVVLHRR